MSSSTRVVKRVTGISKKVMDSLEDELLDAADKGFGKSQELVAENSSDTGMLLRSGQPPFVESGGGSILWGYNSPYAVFVERGTAPHWAPIEPLKDWARRVLGDEEAAYGVQKKIAEKGTEPAPFVGPGVDEMRKELRRIKLDL